MIAAYDEEKRLDPAGNPLAWWKANAARFPELSRLARIYLSSPPTSVPSVSEQLFSGAGIIYNPKGTRLHGDKAEKLLFLKYNLPLLNFNYDAKNN